MGSRAQPSPYPMLFAFMPAARGYREVLFRCPQITGCHPACNWSPVTVSAQQWAHDIERLWLQSVFGFHDELQLIPEVQRWPVDSCLNVIFRNVFLNKASIEICHGCTADGDNTALGSNMCPVTLPLSCCQSRQLGRHSNRGFYLVCFR